MLVISRLPFRPVLSRGDTEVHSGRHHPCRTQGLSMLASTSSAARLSSPRLLHSRCSRSGYAQRTIRHVTYAAVKGKDGYADLLKGVHPDNTEVVSRVLEKRGTARQVLSCRTVYTLCNTDDARCVCATCGPTVHAMIASDRWDTVYTDFLSPSEVADAKMVLERVGDVACVAWGGAASFWAATETVACDLV
eukprot:402609-Pyramimonas_sp.AAC.2